MSTRTDNYNLIICDGSDIVNPLTQIFPNFTSLDDILRDIANTGITTATELVTGTVHALTRSDANVSVFRFQATSNFTSGETFTVDGAQVTALDVSGETLRTGAYIVGSMVLCELRDTLLTVYVSGGSDAQTLEGHPANYFASATDLGTVDAKAEANRTSITALEGSINNINTKITAIESNSVISAVGSSMTTINHDAIKENGMVTLNCSCSGNGLPQNSWVTVGTLVDGWRPTTQTMFTYSDNNSVTSIGRINTNGLIELVNPNSNSSGVLASATFNVTFRLAS